MARITQILGLAAGAGLLAGVVYLPVYLARNDPPPAQLTRKRAEIEVLNIPDATLIGRHQGRKVWQIHARNVISAADGRTTTLKGIDRGTLYQDDRPAARVSAGQAVYTENTGRLLVTGGLSVSAGGMTLRTQRAEWSAARQQIQAPDPVTLTWDGGIARAETVQADTRMKVIMARNVSMAAKLEGPVFEKLLRTVGAAGMAASLVVPASGAPVRYREVKVLHADSARFDETARTRTLRGNVQVVHGDTTLTAQQLVYNEAENTAVVTGSVVADNARNRVEGDSADVDFNEKVIRIRGAKGVRILARPQPSSAKPATGMRARIKEPVTLQCRLLTYYYKEKRAEAAGPLTVKRADQVLTGDWATFRDAQETIVISGNVKGKDERNQTFEAPAVTVSLKEGAEWIEANNIKATFLVKDDDEEAAESPIPVATGEPKPEADVPSGGR